MVRKAEDDLYALAAKAGTEAEASTQAGVSVGTIFLEPEPGQRLINEKGDDPGFETRVRPPKTSGRSRTQKADSGDAPAKKAVGRPRGSSAERSSQEISDALQQKADEFFAVISIGLPVTGTYGVENSEKSIKALMAIAKRRPGLMKALMRVADGADGLDLGRTVLGLGVALQVDLGRIPADMLIARATGVTAVVEKYFADDTSPQNENVTTQVTHASPRFTPIS
jgi:hypothetical protein